MTDLSFISRWQFAITIGVHFIFVSISLGMVWLLFTAETLALKKPDPHWPRLAKFFARLFILTFSFGAATGIVMEFQFGTNWAAFSTFSGDVFGPPLAIETMSAFFLESIFVGLYIFGRDRLPKKIHWFSSLMVALGATLSAFWIIVANSWMQTPAGYTIDNGRVILTDFTAAVLNPSTWPRFFHTTVGLMIAGAFFVAAVGAWLYLRNIDKLLGLRAVKLAIIFGIVTSILELFPFGHWHIMQVAHTQPAKFAAIESVERTQPNAPFVLFGIPFNNPSRLQYDIRIPSMLSLISFGSVDATVKGLDSFDPKDLPPYTLTFTSFHIMVYLGLLFIFIMLVGSWKLYRGTLDSRPFLYCLLFSAPLPLIAIQLGWITAEVGRQPWIIYNVMRTAAGVSQNLTAHAVNFSLWIFIIAYAILLVIYLTILSYLINQGQKE